MLHFLQIEAYCAIMSHDSININLQLQDPTKKLSSQHYLMYYISIVRLSILDSHICI